MVFHSISSRWTLSISAAAAASMLAAVGVLSPIASPVLAQVPSAPTTPTTEPPLEEPPTPTTPTPTTPTPTTPAPTTPTPAPQPQLPRQDVQCPSSALLPGSTDLSQVPFPALQRAQQIAGAVQLRNVVTNQDNSRYELSGVTTGNCVLEVLVSVDPATGAVQVRQVEQQIPTTAVAPESTATLNQFVPNLVISGIEQSERYQNDAYAQTTYEILGTSAQGEQLGIFVDASGNSITINKR